MTQTPDFGRGFFIRATGGRGHEAHSQQLGMSPGFGGSMNKYQFGRGRRFFVADATAAHGVTEKIKARGVGVLSDAELVSHVLLRDRGCSERVERAVGLLGKAGGLQALIDAPPDGMMPAEIRVLQVAIELGQRHLAGQISRGDAVEDPKAGARYFASRLRGRDTEVFAALFLDTQHRAIAFEELFHGTIDSTQVHPRVVAKRALELGAAALIVGHNHPSGNPEPSANDRAITAHLKQVLELFDVRLLDHFVVGDGEPTSMAKEGFV